MSQTQNTTNNHNGDEKARNIRIPFEALEDDLYWDFCKEIQWFIRHTPWTEEAGKKIGQQPWHVNWVDGTVAGHIGFGPKTVWRHRQAMIEKGVVRLVSTWKHSGGDAGVLELAPRYRFNDDSNELFPTLPLNQLPKIRKSRTANTINEPSGAAAEAEERPPEPQPTEAPSEPERPRETPGAGAASTTTEAADLEASRSQQSQPGAQPEKATMIDVQRVIAAHKAAYEALYREKMGEPYTWDADDLEWNPRWAAKLLKKYSLATILEKIIPNYMEMNLSETYGHMLKNIYKMTPQALAWRPKATVQAGKGRRGSRIVEQEGSIRSYNTDDWMSTAELEQEKSEAGRLGISLEELRQQKRTQANQELARIQEEEARHHAEWEAAEARRRSEEEARAAAEAARIARGDLTPAERLADFFVDEYSRLPDALATVAAECIRPSLLGGAAMMLKRFSLDECHELVREALRQPNAAKECTNLVTLSAHIRRKAVA